MLMNFLSGTFNDLDRHQVAALASCFIPVDKSSEQIHLRTELAKPLQQLQESARKIAEVAIFFCSLFCLYYAIDSLRTVRNVFLHNYRYNMKANWT
jgi:hypothetical protein